MVRPNVRSPQILIGMSPLQCLIRQLFQSDQKHLAHSPRYSQEETYSSTKTPLQDLIRAIIHQEWLRGQLMKGVYINYIPIDLLILVSGSGNLPMAPRLSQQD